MESDSVLITELSTLNLVIIASYRFRRIMDFELINLTVMDVADDQVDEIEWATTLEQTSVDKAIAEYQRLGMQIDRWILCR
jgi:hypothetical protein